MQRTGKRRLRARLERVGDDEVLRTERRGQAAAALVDLRHGDALGRGKVDVRLRAGDGLHVARPDRHRPLRAGESGRRVVIEAHPRQREHARREADEPRVALVVRRPGLPRRDLAKAERARAGRGAAIEHAFHHVDQDVHVARREDLHRLDVAAGGDDAVAIVGDESNRAQRQARADARDGGERVRHLDGGDADRAEEHGRLIVDFRVDAEDAHGVDDRIEPAGQADAHRGGVERLLERLAHGDGLVVVVLVVARRPVRREAALEHEARVADQRRRRDVLARQARLECRGVDERLDQRADLPFRVERAIELARVVIAAADQRHDLARRDVHVNDGALQRLVASAQTAVAALQRFQSRLERARRGVLRVEIDRGVDLQPAALDVLDAVVARRLLQHAVDVERNRRQAGAHAERLGRQRRGHRFLIRDLIDLPVAQHRAEHEIAALQREIGAHERRVVVRTADHPRQQRRLREVDLRDRLAEVEARGLAHAHNGDGAVAAEVDVVEVGLEDLFLRELPVEDHGHERFDDLSFHRALVGEVVVLHELLRERRPPLGHAARFDVAEEGAKDADRIDAGVVPEARVLDLHDGVLQRLRHLVQRDGAAILELIGEDGREQLRLQRGIVRVAGLVERHDRIDGAAAKDDADRLRRIVAAGVAEGAGEDVDLAAARHEVAALRQRVALAIAEALELFAEIIGRQQRAGLERHVVGVDARRQREAAHFERGDRLLVNPQREGDEEDDKDGNEGEESLQDSVPTRQAWCGSGHRLLRRNCKVASTFFVAPIAVKQRVTARAQACVDHVSHAGREPRRRRR